MMCFVAATVAVVSVDNVQRYPRPVVNLEGCPQGGTVHQPALRFTCSSRVDEKYTSAGVW